MMGSYSRQAYVNKSAEAAPESLPKIVMRLGSPPKECMLSRTHSIARRWSRRPRLMSGRPGALGNPKILIR
jgi:hypothetical protein